MLCSVCRNFFVVTRQMPHVTLVTLKMHTSLFRPHAPLLRPATRACAHVEGGCSPLSPLALRHAYHASQISPLTSHTAAARHLLPPPLPGHLPVLRVGLQLRLRDHYASDQHNAAAAAASASADASISRRPPFPAHFFARCSSTEWVSLLLSSAVAPTSFQLPHIILHNCPTQPPIRLSRSLHVQRSHRLGEGGRGRCCVPGESDMSCTGGRLFASAGGRVQR